MIGLPKATVQIEDPLPNLIFKSVTLTTVHGRRIFHTWEQCEQLIQEGKVRVESDMTSFISSNFPRLTPHTSSPTSSPWTPGRKPTMFFCPARRVRFL